ncbi:MAG: SpoIID/LytB domain-containing protein, partial [Smithellaceae bacterium]|nr:SpoIID/LytB domain-containing protein [Smithellaceae bacterium]
RSYRGRLIVKRGAGVIELINELPLEWYLYGVVPREMSPRWPLEALKAQAVAARTYAFYLKGRSNSPDYHLCATTMSQVYSGAGFETEDTNRAVDETRGELLYFRGMPVLAYFHAHSGGITEDPKDVWFAQVPYMKAVADSFSMKAPSSAWAATLDYETIRRSLSRAGIDLGAIERIAPLEISPSGRVTRLKVVHQGGESVLSGNEFRLRIDPKLIRSTLFALTDTGSAVTIEGRGYGHGVGMSQWGAQVMAREGYSYREILTYYYPEVEIR